MLTRTFLPIALFLSFVLLVVLFIQSSAVSFAQSDDELFEFENTVTAQGTCTLESLISGTCHDCQSPNTPLDPSTREANRKLGSPDKDIRDCAVLRIQRWWQQFFAFETFRCVLGRDCTPLAIIDRQFRNFFASYFSDDGRSEFEDQPLQSEASPRPSGEHFDAMRYRDPFNRITGKDLTGVNQKTLAVLEYVAERVNHNVIVSSAFRDEDYNREVDGARRSQHVNGAAIDISTFNLTREELLHLIRVVLSHPDVNGFGYYQDAIHFDTRPVRTGFGYWGFNFSRTSFDQGASTGVIDPEIVQAVYHWAGRGQ